MSVVRVMVEDLRGNAQVVDVDTDLVTDEARQLIGDAIAEVSAETGTHPETVALHMVAELVQRHHDAAAYEREAARRGVLAL